MIAEALIIGALPVSSLALGYMIAKHPAEGPGTFLCRLTGHKFVGKSSKYTGHLKTTTWRSTESCVRCGAWR